MRFPIIPAAVSALAIGSAAQALPDRPVHRFLAVALSPDGKQVASVEGASEPSGAQPASRDLVIRSVEGGAAITVALPCGRVEECWPSSPVWSPDGARVVFALRVPGSHARSLYSVARDGGGVTRLAAFDGSIDALRFGPGGRLAMLATAGANKETGATQAGAAITGDLGGPPPEQRIAVLDGDTLRFASPPDLFVYQYDWRPDGGFVGTAAHGDGDNNWWIAKLYAFTGGAARVIHAPADARHQIADPRVSPDGRSVAFISGIMSDFGSTGGDVFVAPIAGGVARDVTPDMRGSASRIGWSCDGHILVERLAGDRLELGALDPREARPAAVTWGGTESLDAVDETSSRCGGLFDVAVHESFTAPPEIELAGAGGWRDLTTANAGLSAPVQARSLNWKSDGFEVQGWLLSPTTPLAGAAKRPMIVEVHGGPAAAATPRFVGPGTLRALLERGYAVLLPNPRGSYGQGEAFTAANVRDFGHGDLRDILAGIDAAERVAPIDEARLGLTGGSYGGFMTMWAVTQTHRFKAAVAAAGISDWLSYYGENGIDQWMIPYFGASAYDDPAVYARSSAIDYIHAVSTPTFEYVGAQDIECPPGQTQEFWHALRDLGVPTSMAIYPGEGHGLRNTAHVEDAERRTVQWFDRYLK